ncbi:MAG TPA: hypothetical protein VHW44_12715 [Pseudonocardiaceae bacterium]|jgi:hypothetical protein|nr:hypothetical protein [Pseudonocardiaceae bacterium]
MNVYVLGLLWVLGVAAIAAGLVIALRKFIAAEKREEHDETTGGVFTVVDGLHAVLLGFVLISLFDAVGTADDGSYQEANGVVAVYWAADSLPQPAASRIRVLCLSYAATVVDDEWPQMTNGRPIGDEGATEINEMRQLVAEVQSTDDWQRNRQAEVANQLTTVYQARQARLEAANERINPILWYSLIIGGIISVGLTYLFGGPKLVTHIVVVSTFAAVLTLLLFATYELQNPFSGGVRVSPEAFESVIQQLRT